MVAGLRPPGRGPRVELGYRSARAWPRPSSPRCEAWSSPRSSTSFNAG